MARAPGRKAPNEQPGGVALDSSSRPPLPQMPGLKAFRDKRYPFGIAVVPAQGSHDHPSGCTCSEPLCDDRAEDSRERAFCHLE